MTKFGAGIMADIVVDRTDPYKGFHPAPRVDCMSFTDQLQKKTVFTRSVDSTSASSCGIISSPVSILSNSQFDIEHVSVDPNLDSTNNMLTKYTEPDNQLVLDELASTVANKISILQNEDDAEFQCLNY